MKKFPPFMFFVFGAIFAYQFFIDSPSRSASSQPDNALETYGQKGVRNDWPAFTSSSNNVLAPSLTAANYYLIVDGSGSMSENGCSAGKQTKMTTAKRALREFISQIPEDANIGVYAFDAGTEGERLALAPGNNQRAMATIERMQPAGGTPLGRSIRDGVTALTEQARKQLGYGEYNLVVITDGAANSTETLNLEVDKMLRSTPVLLHTIGFCINQRHALNKPGYTLYKSANNPASLRESLNTVLAEAPSFDVDAFQQD